MMQMGITFDFDIHWDTWTYEDGNVDQSIDAYLQQSKAKSTQYKECT